MRTGRVVATVALVAAVLVASAVAGLWWVGEGRDRSAGGAEAGPSDRAGAGSSSSADPAPPTSSPTSAHGGDGSGCDTGAGPVDPRRIAVPDVTGRVPVVTPPRDGNGVPGVPALTERGKNVFAFDREQGVRPGDPAGNVLLNAHTWPDGSALGNALLDGLHRGDLVVVLGDGKRLCYRVTERVEVLAEDGLPRYYDTDGPPQLAIVVCSGRRLAPGVWEKRTVWFASPVTRG